MVAGSRPRRFAVEIVARTCQGDFSGEHEAAQLGGTSFRRAGTRLRQVGPLSKPETLAQEAEQEPRALLLPKPQCAYEAPGILTKMQALIQQIWDGAFLTSSQAVLMRQVYRTHSEAKAMNLLWTARPRTTVWGPPRPLVSGEGRRWSAPSTCEDVGLPARLSEVLDSVDKPPLSLGSTVLAQSRCRAGQGRTPQGNFHFNPGDKAGHEPRGNGGKYHISRARPLEPDQCSLNLSVTHCSVM